MSRAAPYDRDAALDAAMSIFWDKGYHATSLKDLEAALSMKPGSIYAAFQCKENLYLLALERYFTKFHTMFRDQITNAASPVDALANHLRSYARLPRADATRQACMLTKSVIDTRTTDPAIADRSREYLGKMRHEIALAFERARELGELAPDIQAARLALRYQVNIAALRFELHQDSDAQNVSELADDMAREVESLRA